MNVTIRPATVADLPFILDIVNDAIINTTAIYDYEPRSLEVQRRWFDEKIQNNFPVIVAEYGAHVVGFGAYGTFRVRDAYQFTVEHSVYVEKSFIGKGVGGLLMKELIRLATASNVHTMIGGIDASNTASIDFHRRFGFTEAGIIKEAGYKFGQWLDLMFMQLMIKR